MIKYLKIVWKLWKFMYSEVFLKAQSAMEAISEDRGLRHMGELEGKGSYCPRCGQRPDHDIRHDAAFELAYGALAVKQRKRDLHFAVELAYWLKR